MDKSLSKIINSVKWIFLIQSVQSILQFGASIIFARLIFPSVFGKVAYIIAVVEGLSLLMSIGIKFSIIENKTFVETDFKSIGFFILIFLLSFYFISGLLVNYLFITELKFFFILILISKTIFHLSDVHVISMQKEFYFRKFHIIRFASFLIANIIAIILAYLKLSLFALIFQYFFFHVVFSILVLSYSKFTIKYLISGKHRMIQRYLQNGKEIFVSNFFEKLISIFDQIYIKKFLGDENLGYFNRSILLDKKLTFSILGIFSSLINVSFAKYQYDTIKIRKLFQNIIWMVSRISTLITALVVFSAPQIIYLFYGDKWMFSAVLIPFLGFFSAFSPIRNICQSYFLSTGKYRILKIVQIKEYILLVGILIIGAYIYEIIGLVIGISIWMFLSVILNFSQVINFVNIALNKILWFPTIVLFIVFGSNYIGFSFYSVSSNNIFIEILVNMIIVTILYIVSLVIFERSYIRNAVDYIKTR